MRRREKFVFIHSGKNFISGFLLSRVEKLGLILRWCWWNKKFAWNRKTLNKLDEWNEIRTRDKHKTFEEVLKNEKKLFLERKN